MKFLSLPAELTEGTDIILKRIKAENIDVTLNVTQSDILSVGFKDGTGFITYRKKHHFFRLLSIFVQKYTGSDFIVEEKENFETLSCMLDVSYGSAPTLRSLFEFLERMALMGFNQLQIYMEDMYEIKERPHFGYLRGRYSFDELKRLDDYAYMFGIEIVPCIETLGHMQNYLRWPEAASVSENSAVLLPECEETYEFIEQMMKTASAPFRSKRIHVGLDETYGLGLGNYLNEHGHVEPIEIFTKHVKRVTGIAIKLGLKPMMWNDMIFCYSSKTNRKYDKDVVIPPKIANEIPKEMQFVYWNYEDLDAESFMIDKHYAIGKKDTMFAGGVWIWAGVLPDNVYSSMHTERALRTCKEKGVREIMLTVWSFGNTIYQTALLEMHRYAELTYNDDSSQLKERFEFCTGASYDAFIRMSDFHALYSSGKDYDSLPYDERFAGNKIMWQDIMLGLFDGILINEPRSGHYEKGAQYFDELTEKGGEWENLYKFCRSVFEYMSIKCEIAEKLIPAYKKGDRETLKYISNSALPLLYEKADTMHFYHSLHKETYLKPFGGEKMDIQYGALKERCKHAQRRLNRYLDGEIDMLDELEQERLPIKIEAWGLEFDNIAKISV